MMGKPGISRADIHSGNAHITEPSHICMKSDSLNPALRMDFSRALYNLLKEGLVVKSFPAVRINQPLDMRRISFSQSSVCATAATKSSSSFSRGCPVRSHPFFRKILRVKHISAWLAKVVGYSPAWNSARLTAQGNVIYL